MKLKFNSSFDKAIMEPFHIDCSHCLGLCCVALYFSKIDGFPKDKEAGKPCLHLQRNHQCDIHASLKQRGLKGCMHYDCFGAGQYVSQRLCTDVDWKTIQRKDAELIFQSYTTVLHLHQTLWYLQECNRLCLSPAEYMSIQTLYQEGNRIKEQTLEILASFDIQPFTQKANSFLKNICNTYASHDVKIKSKHYLGKDLRKQSLIGQDLSMSLLIGANIEGMDLYGTMFLGADMRDTNICNTDLRHSLFLTQIQINATKGNQQTLLPSHLSKPTSW